MLGAIDAGADGVDPYVSTPPAEPVIAGASAATAGLPSAAGASSVCLPRVHGGIAMNWSNSVTGLFVSLQHAGVSPSGLRPRSHHDLRPSWNTGPPGWYTQSPSALAAASYSFPQPLWVQRGIFVACYGEGC